MQDTLLIELLTEELPPRSLRLLAESFTGSIAAGLAERGFLPVRGQEPEVLATPRRLAVQLTGVLGTQPEQDVERKGPYVASGLDADGKPTPALLGFARSCGADPSALERASDAKGEYFVFRSRKAGEALDAHLEAIVQAAVKRLPISKLMRWGDSEVQFVRPVHAVVMLHGARVVEGSALGRAAGRVTHGHRFLGEGAIELGHAAEYAQALSSRGCVVASFAERRGMIARKLAAEAGRLGAALREDEALLDEVTALVEWPAVYAGGFDPAFLEVPEECLILSMRQHQKYFPLFDSDSGRLLPRFLVVSNLETDDPANIVQGNERVLRARLADARFFFDQDRRTRLAERVARLGDVVYHNRLGSQLERVQRIQKLAGSIARRLGAEAEMAERAALLAKADLLTDMVGEFPELQGIMGRYYALHDGEPPEVADAVRDHYLPRFAGDALPQGNVALAVALADRLDTLVGIFGIGLAPTGDKDPFALRRHALGVLRILAEQALPLDLLELLSSARCHFPAEVLADSVAVDLHRFMLDRLRGWLRERGFTPGEIEAVASQNPTRIDQVAPRLEAVRAFLRLPEAESLAAANKRIQNILKKADVPAAAPDPALMQEDAERTLFAALNAMAPQVGSLVANRDYTDALALLAGLRKDVDTFFDQVMVMTDEPLVRDNRLALLRELAALMNQVADISRLAA